LSETPEHQAVAAEPVVTAGAISARTAIILLIFAAVFTAALALTYSATRDEIAAAAEQEKLRLIDEVLPRTLYDNALLKDTVTIGPVAELGLDRPAPVYRARKGGKPVALVMETAAPDGYSGRIDLVVAVMLRGNGHNELGGVRVVTHKETPGLGDYIDPRKDRNKEHPWIAQFNGLSYANVTPAQWKVKKDGGRFHYMTGATISARAVVRASGAALKYADQNAGHLLAERTP
jgi:Na+-translocating ferredoxin:NAD+ oxidoreductase subunit G